MRTANCLAPGVAGCPRGATRQGEGADARSRRDGGRAPADAVDGRGEGVPLRRTPWTGEPCGPVRGRGADRLPRLLCAGRHHLPSVGRRLPERACAGCSFEADQVAHPAHLNARETTLAYVSRAPQAEIQGLQERMGWELIPWYTLTDDFDKDFGVDQWHGHNAFIREGDRIFRTYFVDARGDEHLGTTWSYLDITALGRQEEWEDSPDGYPQTPPYEWWNYHDAYGKDA